MDISKVKNNDFKNWQPLLNAILDPVCLIDIKHTILQCNKAFAAFVSKPLSQIPGSCCWELVHPQEGSLDKCPVKKSIITRERTKITHQLGDKWFQVTADPFFDEQNNFVCAIHIFSDITDQKITENKFSQEAQLQNSIINGFHDAISVLDSDLNIVMVNDRVRQMLPANATIIGSKCFQMYHQRQQPCENCPSHRALQSGEMETEEVLFIDKDSNELTLELRVFPIKNEAGNITHIAEFVRDITLKKQADTEKKQADIALGEQAELLTVGKKIGQVLSHSFSMQEMLQGCATVINENIGAAFTRIWLYNDADKILELQASAGMYTHIEGKHQCIPLGQYKIGKIAAERTPHITNSVVGDPQVHNQEWAKQEGMVAFAGHPLTVNDKLLGVLGLFAKKVLSDSALTTISSVVEEIALGIERIQQQEKLERSELQYRRLIENLKDKYFFYIYNSEGIFSYLSPSASHILGYPLQQIMSHYSTYLTDSPINKDVHKYTNQCVQGQFPPPYEVELQHKNGQIVTLEVMEQPIFEKNSVVGVEGIAHDITNRKKNEEMLRRKNRTLATLSNCREALRSSQTEQQFLDRICEIIVDTGGYQLAWIGFAEDNPEKSIRPVSQEGYEEGYLSEIKISWGDNIHGIGPTGTAIRDQRTVVCRNTQNDPSFAPWRELAKKYNYSSSVAIPFFIDGKLKGAVNIYSQDVNAFDEEEIQLIDELVSDVSTGIKTFHAKEARRQAERQLHQAERMEAIGTLAGGIAHDFNNILSPILGFTQIVIDDLPHESLHKKDLEIVYKSAIRAQQLVKQILTFSRQDEAQMFPCMVAPLIKETTKLLRSSLPSSIKITQNITTDPVMVKSSASYIHQIVMNLCTNSFHAMEKNGGTLSVSLKRLSTDQISYGFIPQSDFYAELIVEDTGHGIEQDTLGKIFQPYFTTKVHGKGTGLGLAVVYGIIENLQGEIFIESEVNSGTKIHVFLPITEDFQVPTGEPPSPLQSGTETILIVDDEEFVAKPILRSLTNLGYKATIVTSSVEALGLFNEHKEQIDLVITDFTMPEMSGAELAQKILEVKPDIPIILMTGYSSQMDETKAFALGIKAFLMKPVSRETLTQTIRLLLDDSTISKPV